MSDAIAKARRLNNEDIRYVPPRAVVNAMLDVLDAAERSVSPRRMGSDHQEAGRGSGYCDSCLRSWPCEGSELRAALARFSEVSGE